MISSLNHVAILVKSVDLFAKNKHFREELLGKVEDFPSEGTRELYIGQKNQYGRLLVMEAIADGSYKRALKKRGPSLHHVAIDVENIDEFVDSLVGSGWFLHPRSLSLYAKCRQIYLCRPGVPTIIEVQDKKEQKELNSFVDEIVLPFGDEKLLQGLRCKQIQIGCEAQLKIGGNYLKMKDLLD